MDLTGLPRHTWMHILRLSRMPDVRGEAAKMLLENDPRDYELEEIVQYAPRAWKERAEEELNKRRD